MPLFDSVTEIDPAVVASIVATNWNLQLGKRLKASQNHTFVATNEDSVKFAVRVTPDPQQKFLNKIQDELTFVNFLASYEGLSGVCAPIRTTNNELFVQSNDLIVVVSTWAEGDLVDFMGYRWLTDADFIRAWGAWMGQMHNASREFSRTYPETAQRMQKWDDIHDKLMKGVEIDPEDANASGDEIGILHGDVNISNFHMTSDNRLHVFDWDQAHSGWWEWDVAQAALAAFMFSEAGAVVVGTPVPEAQPERFLNWFGGGYNSTANRPVNEQRLNRMVALRRKFYGRFAERALGPERSTVPPEMLAFLEYVDRWANGAAAAESRK